MTEGIFFALPIYEGNIKPAFMTSLMSLQCEMIHANQPHDFYFMTNESLVTRARNNCMARFMESEYSHMMFIDSDTEFKPENVATLWNHGQDGHELVSGAYRMKRPGAAYSAWYKGELLEDLTPFEEEPLIEVDYAGTGFWLISRKCVEKMIAAYPETKHDAGGFDAWDLFGVGVRPSDTGPFYVSEDFDFCAKWRQIGGKVMLDTSVRLPHWGSCAY